MADDRPAVADAGVSATVLSDGAVGMLKDLVECTAVVRIAFTRSTLFCRFLCPRVTVNFRFCDESTSGGCVSSVTSSRLRFLLSSEAGASLIGQIKPVRGVYAGRCERSVSKEVCNE